MIKNDEIERLSQLHTEIRRYQEIAEDLFYHKLMNISGGDHPTHISTELTGGGFLFTYWECDYHRERGIDKIFISYEELIPGIRNEKIDTIIN